MDYVSQIYKMINFKGAWYTASKSRIQLAEKKHCEMKEKISLHRKNKRLHNIVGVKFCFLLLSRLKNA